MHLQADIDIEKETSSLHKKRMKKVVGGQKNSNKKLLYQVVSLIGIVCYIILNDICEMFFFLVVLIYEIRTPPANMIIKWRSRLCFKTVKQLLMWYGIRILCYNCAGGL